MNEALLREYVRTVLKEDSDGNPYLGGGGGMGGVGGAWNAELKDLTDTFITPITDIFKTAASETKQMMRRAGTLIWTSIQTILTTFIPTYGYTYEKVFERQEEDLKKIKEEYKDVYERTDKAFRSSDAGLLAFMTTPAIFLGVHGTGIAAKSVKGLLSTLTGGKIDSVIGSLKDKLKSKGNDSSTHHSSKKRVEASLHHGKILLEDVDSVINAIESSPKMKEMQSRAKKIYQNTLLQIYEQASELLNIKTIEELEKSLKEMEIDPKDKKNIEVEIKKIKDSDPKERQAGEKLLFERMKAEGKKFYKTKLEAEVKEAIEAANKVGVKLTAENSPFVKDYEQVIDKISAL